jgi:hypothetical protein
VKNARVEFKVYDSCAVFRNRNYTNKIQASNAGAWVFKILIGFAT